MFKFKTKIEQTSALGIAAASFFEAREKDIAESPTRKGNAQIKIVK
jgi:hypothetical protein